MVDLGGMQYCDAISLHAYPYGTFSDVGKNTFISSLESYRNITNKEVWITESGQESIGNSEWHSSELEQNSFLSQSYNILQKQNVKAYIWYELNDSSERNSTFGLYDINLEPKICLQTFFTLANSSKSTLTSTPSLNPTVAVPEFSWLVILPLFLTMLSIAVVARFKKTLTNKKSLLYFVNSYLVKKL